MKLQEGLKAAALAEPDKPEKVNVTIIVIFVTIIFFVTIIVIFVIIVL